MAHKKDRTGDLKAVGVHRQESGTYQVSMTVEITDGPDAGRRVFVTMSSAQASSWLGPMANASDRAANLNSWS